MAALVLFRSSRKAALVLCRSSRKAALALPNSSRMAALVLFRSSRMAALVWFRSSRMAALVWFRSSRSFSCSLIPLATVASNRVTFAFSSAFMPSNLASMFRPIQNATATKATVEMATTLSTTATACQ